MLRLIVAAIFLVSSPMASIAADVGEYKRVVAFEIGVPFEITPGQAFYEDTVVKLHKQYEIPAPFEARMLGGLGVHLSFGIDTTELTYSGKSSDGSIEYYVPEDGKFRAWHSLVGNALAPGDSVGLQVSRDGKMQWFVDNRKFSRASKIWSRPIRKGEPIPTKSDKTKAKSFGAPIRKLEYLGVRGADVVIRSIELKPDQPPRTDEFLFPLDPGSVSEGVIVGAHFSIRVHPSRRAEIIVTTPMTTRDPERLPWVDNAEATFHEIAEGMLERQ